MRQQETGLQSVNVRACHSTEVPVILDLWRRAGAVPSATDDAASVRGLIARDDQALLGAEVEGRLVGTLIAAWDGWRGNMYRLAVLPEYRRRDIARQLVLVGEQRLRQRGARRVSALVVTAHDEAVRLWAAMGYGHDERMGRFVKDLD